MYYVCILYVFIVGSVLFADIVNFTPLTSSLSPFALIVVLNDLYGKFDILAEVS